MACYISSNDNRIYVHAENSLHEVTGFSAADRTPAVRLALKHTRPPVERRDKTGSRTYRGMPAGLRTQTAWRLRTYMTGWSDMSVTPVHATLFSGALGTDGLRWDGGAVEECTGSSLRFTGAHGLVPLQAVAFGGEIRFVAAVLSESEVELNAPFTMSPSGGTQFGPTMTWVPGRKPRPMSVLDCWSPETSVQRVLAGAVADEMKIRVNADWHEFEFGGPAGELIDSESFAPGQSAMEQFPGEPADTGFDYTIIPGHLGQVWLGVMPERFLTLTGAEISLRNHVEMRANEFGQATPRCFSTGVREVAVAMTLTARDDEASRGLYQAARTGQPVSMMFQLGQQPGQLFGAYMKSVVPQTPEFDDQDLQLEWKFGASRAEGASDDELVVAFA